MVKETDLLAVAKDLFSGVPAVGRVEIRQASGKPPLRPDGILKVHLKGGGSLTFVVEIKSQPLEPRMAETAALRLREMQAALKDDHALVVAPYVSPASAERLAHYGISYGDLSGNCRLAAGPLFIERTGFPNVHARKSTHRSLFTPAAERILRALLDPLRRKEEWTIRRIAEAAYPGVSIGEVHKVLRLLEDWQLLLREGKSFGKLDAEKLLRQWGAGYRFKRNRAEHFYSSMNGSELQNRFSRLVQKKENKGNGAMASFTAAEILAPHVRQYRTFFYWRGDRDVLVQALALKPVPTGDNVVIYTPYDEGVLYPYEADALPVTCPVQTYLDLLAAPARGEEAAEALFEKQLRESYRR